MEKILIIVITLIYFNTNRNAKKKQLRNAKPRLSRSQNKKENTRRNVYSLMMNKLHHQQNHPTHPQPLPHQYTQQLPKHPPQAIPHHHNPATQPLNQPQLHLIQPQNHLTNQVINHNPKHKDKDVSLAKDSVVKLSEKNQTIQSFRANIISHYRMKKELIDSTSCENSTESTQEEIHLSKIYQSSF